MAKNKTHRLPVAQAVRVFKLCADESRLRLLLLLAEKGEANVGTLTEALGHSQPAISHHLMLLRAGGLVESRREGQCIIYRIRSPVVADLLQLICGQ